MSPVPDRPGVDLPGLGPLDPADGFCILDGTSDGRFAVGRNGVEAVVATGDRKVEFVSFGTHTMARVDSAMGYPAWYPVHPVRIDPPVEAVLMDLDGTTVHSEAFWIWIIQRTVASLLDRPAFELSDDDLPHVSGHSVSEHLQYCLRKYCPERTVEEARTWYFTHTHREMALILEGKGRKDAFRPAPGVRDFLLAIKGRGLRIGLVTSGLYEKAFPEILSAFDTMGLGDPREFYDCIISAGYPLRKGEPGTLGELAPKPHPWLYAETCRIGLGIPFERRHHVIGLEDSGAGVCSIRLAGFAAIGLEGGNIRESGTAGLCHRLCATFDAVLEAIR